MATAVDTQIHIHFGAGGWQIAWVSIADRIGFSTKSVTAAVMNTLMFETYFMDSVPMDAKRVWRGIDVRGNRRAGVRRMPASEKVITCCR